MKIIIDTDKQEIVVKNKWKKESFSMYSQEGFRILSDHWLKVQWNQQHWKSLSWCGLPIWQLPEDLIRLQEVVLNLKPDVIIETGINLGGSALFFASLCKIMGKGKVISLDITIPEHVKISIEKNDLNRYIHLIESDSVAPAVIQEVKSMITSTDTVFAFLDSDHSKSHVLAELQAYSDFVTPGSYIVATDGVMGSLADTPNGHEHWIEDNPSRSCTGVCCL